MRRWLADGRIALMFDGLDEIPDQDVRRRCVRAINSYLDRSPAGAAVIVASRPDEYAEITERGADALTVNAGIQLRSLRPLDMVARLDGTPVGALLQKEGLDSSVAELLRRPLWLWVAQSLDHEEATLLEPAGSVGDNECVLADALVDHAIQELGTTTPLSEQGRRRVLAAIAAFLADERTPDATTFRLHDLTPAQPPMAYRTGFALAATVVLVAAGTLTIGPAAAAVGALFGWSTRFALELSPSAEPARSRFHWPGFLAMLRAASGWWLFVASAVGLGVGVTVGPGSGVAYGLIAVVALTLAEQLVAREPGVVPTSVDDGWWMSRASVAVQVTVAGLLGMLSYGTYASLTHKPLVGWLVYGLYFGLVGGGVVASGLGGWYLLLQARLRREAAATGQLPQDLVAFLECAADAKVMRRTGGGVQFRHRSFANRLADEGAEPNLADLRERLMTGSSARP